MQVLGRTHGVTACPEVTPTGHEDAILGKRSLRPGWGAQGQNPGCHTPWQGEGRCGEGMEGARGEDTETARHRDSETRRH